MYRISVLEALGEFSLVLKSVPADSIRMYGPLPSQQEVSQVAITHPAAEYSPGQGHGRNKGEEEKTLRSSIDAVCNIRISISVTRSEVHTARLKVDRTRLVYIRSVQLSFSINYITLKSIPYAYGFPQFLDLLNMHTRLP